MFRPLPVLPLAAAILLVLSPPAEAEQTLIGPIEAKQNVNRLRLKLSSGQGGLRRSAVPPPAGSLEKIDAPLRDRLSEAIGGARLRGGPDPLGFLFDEQGRVSVEMRVADVEARTTDLESLGMRVTASSEAFGTISGWLPLEQLVAAASLPGLKSVTANRPGKDVGSVTSQGDAVHNGPEARSLGVTGDGVEVGIISDSVNQVAPGLGGSQAGGDLPGVTLVSAEPVLASDEGRAMAEIVYDTAPGIPQFYFGSGTLGGATDKAQSIDALVAAGVDIIADDIFFLTEPFFQDGQVAASVDAAHAAGVVYLASAGNRGRQSYEGLFQTSSGNFHDFDPGAGIDQTNTVAVVPPGGFVRVALQWNQAWGEAATDFDVFLFVSDPSGLSTVAVCDADNIATGLPLEQCDYINGTGDTQLIVVGILRFNGPASAFLKYIAHLGNGSSWSPQWDTQSDAINPGAASARGSLAIAATNWPTPSSLASYSSRGPKTRLFDAMGDPLSSPEVRFKPDLAGADCVATSPTFTGGQGFGGGAFCGTSAGTPSVAGIAALIREVAPYPPEIVRAFLHETSVDIDAPGPDVNAGHGRGHAEEAVLQAIFAEFVEPLGGCGGLPNCDFDLQDALDGVPDGITVRVAPGSYGVVFVDGLNGPLSVLEAGWNQIFTERAGRTLTISSAPIPGEVVASFIEISEGVLQLK